MDREQIKEYFFTKLKDIIEEYPQIQNAFTRNDGNEYCDSFEINLVPDIYDKFLVDINYGATKLVFISSEHNEIAKNYVLKAPFFRTDYCSTEVDNYTEVCSHYREYAKYFAETWCAGDFEVEDSEGFKYIIPLYIMRRADINEEVVERSSYDFYLDCGGEPDDYYVDNSDEETLNCFKQIYGFYTGEEIENIIDELEITDIHSSNVGFIDGEPVFIDYSGYWG